MKAMILAAGLGTRMEELTRQTPKPLLPALGVPLIVHTLYMLYRQGCSYAAINTHYLADQLKDYLQGFPYFPLEFSHETHLLGTGGGICTALSQTSLSGSFWVLNPDCIYFPQFSLIRAASGFQVRQREIESPVPPLLGMQERLRGSNETGFRAQLEIDSQNSSKEGQASSQAMSTEPQDDPYTSPTGSGDDSSAVETFNMSFDKGGALKYTGLGLLEETQFAGRSAFENYHVVDDWRHFELAPGGLMGFVYRGTIMDLGRKSDYLRYYNHRDAFPLTYRDGLVEFLSRWKG
jgi:hypothetical protein